MTEREKELYVTGVLEGWSLTLPRIWESPLLSTGPRTYGWLTRL